MKKSFFVVNEDEIDALKEKVLASINKASLQLQSELSNNNAISVFSKMKFGGVGYDPLNTDRELNIIEQINQSFTYLASFNALEFLFKSYPQHAPYKLNLGTASGSDIESACGSISAEVFASVSPTNNQKIKKDIDKVLETNSAIKYAFFMSPGYDVGRQEKHERDGVIVWSLGCIDAL
ncbi:hypothetical protein [Aliivibrio fischeri]|uniref:hypothetical protein n=1 Tax=Aliivibrio fischeri TaxID=668 RepID=UPI0012D9DFD7|nr:hypothetical protein [Aliivibrio fischeri]MUK79129.1 hypothetical protein [Aliivibrio fischeri]MUL17326.1 hypothetical protein [Aliivibrio fischeri]